MSSCATDAAIRNKRDRSDDCHGADWMIRHRHDGTAKHAGNRALLRAAAVGERGHLVHGQLRSLQIMMSADVNNAPRTCADNYDPVPVASKAGCTTGAWRQGPQGGGWRKARDGATY